MLYSLDDSYTNLTMALEAREEKDFTPDCIKIKLTDEHTHHQETNTQTRSMQAFKGVQKHKQIPRTNKFSTYCHQKSYTKEECRHLKNKTNLNT